MIPDGWELKDAHPDLASLTEWAVEARYPGDWPEATATDAQMAVEQARAVWTSVSAELVQHGFHEAEIERLPDDAKQE